MLKNNVNVLDHIYHENHIICCYFLVDEEFVSNLTTVPKLRNNKFVSGLKKLDLTVTGSSVISRNWRSCFWKVWTYKSIIILDHLNPCPNQYCEETEKYCIFSLSITDPIPSYLNISLECFNEPDEEFIKSWLWQSEGMKT